MNEITTEVLQEFKDRMRLGDDEDENLTRILLASLKVLIINCGRHDIVTDEPFKELVFERARYVYNDALEFFNKNFLSQINTLALAKALEVVELDESETEGEDDATV